MFKYKKYYKSKKYYKNNFSRRHFKKKSDNHKKLYQGKFNVSLDLGFQKSNQGGTEPEAMKFFYGNENFSSFGLAGSLNSNNSFNNFKKDKSLIKLVGLSVSIICIRDPCNPLHNKGSIAIIFDNKPLPSNYEELLDLGTSIYVSPKIGITKRYFSYKKYIKSTYVSPSPGICGTVVVISDKDYKESGGSYIVNLCFYIKGY